MKSQFDAIIIGGGLGGLTAGATLAKKGKSVLLVEQHYVPGGCATAFKRKDYIMEVGLHEMDGLHEDDTKPAIFEFLGIDKMVEFIQVPELFRYKSRTIDFVFPHGFSPAIKSLVDRYPDEEKGIRKYFSLLKGTLTELEKFPTQKWKQRLMTPIMPLLFPNIVKASRKSLGNWMDANLGNEELKLLLQANLVYFHDDPYSMSMIYYSAGQGSYSGGGGHFVKGGSQKLSDALKLIIEQNGGQVLLGKTATEILMDNNAVAGISFVDTFNDSISEIKVKSKHVIANIAIPLIGNLLPKKEADKIAKKIDHLENACSLLTVYLGLKKDLKLEGHNYYSTFIVGDNVSSLKDIKANNTGNWNDKTFVFVDYSQIDSGLAPKGKGFGAICAADYLEDWDKLSDKEYKAKKDEVAIILIDRLEKEFPGIKEHIECYEVATAKTIKRYTLNPSGTAYGFAQTPEQAGMNRVPMKSDTKGLYFAGAWTFPGGGFTGAIISGFLCGTDATKSIGENNSSPKTLVDNRIVSLTSKEIIAKNTIEICFEKPQGFNFISGQYAILDILDPKYVEIDLPHRPLSIVSHPNDDFIKFTMRLSDSSFKKSIDEMELGEKCRLFGPMGDFTLKTSDRSIVFIVSGIGITPIIPFLKDLESMKYQHSVTLFYSNKSIEETSYHDLLKSINIPNYQYLPTFTKTENRINKDSLLKELNTVENTDFYIVGTDSFAKSFEGILTELLVPENRTFIDSFG